MALVIKELIRGYHHCFEELADPRSHDFFFMRSPLPVFATIGLYLLFIFKWGPKYMANREPYNLKTAMIVFNVFQIVINAYIFSCGLTVWSSLNMFCSPVSYGTDDVSMFTIRCVWLYYMVKISDLIDTVFFVLRKKQKQVSFLHVYHHIGMVLLTYGGVKYYAGGHSIYLGLLNTLVHLAMYTYYLLTVLNPEYKKSMWWKKHITQLQIIQFLLLTIIYGAPLLNPFCAFPKFPLILFLLQNVFMLVLFGDFYRKTYMKQKPEKNIKQG